MNTAAQKVARFGLMTALTLILGLLDRSIPLSQILFGVVLGIRLGLANTVLLYAVYLMDWQSALALMLVKALLSGFLYGSLTAILYSLSGGTLSLAIMLLIRKRPDLGALALCLAAAATDAVMLTQNPHPRGERLWSVILIAIAFAVFIAGWFAIRKGKIRGVPATSIAGAMAHSTGQVLMASAVLHIPQLLILYLPALLGINAAVGALTGMIAERIFRALHINPRKYGGRKP